MILRSSGMHHGTPGCCIMQGSPQPKCVLMCEQALARWLNRITRTRQCLKQTSACLGPALVTKLEQ